MIDKIKQKHKEGGFTIIEVMIVLAIAGLIMIVIFLAVPALQRNSRNTTRRADVSNILGSISTYQGNNGGAAITTSNFAAASGESKLGYYTSSNVFLQTTEANAPAAAAAVSVANSATSVNLDGVIVVTGAKCNAAGTATDAATSRSVAALYVIDSGSAANGEIKCIDG